MTVPLLSVAVAKEPDVVLARRRARQLATSLGFEPQDGTRLATAVSEIARNALLYAGGGKVEFHLMREEPRALLVRVGDKGPGISHLHDVLTGRYKSNTGMGLGLIGTRRLMDGFEIDSRPDSGTTVSFWKYLPKTAPPLQPGTLAGLAERIVQEPRDDYGEMQRQNQELLAALEALQEKQEELTRLNRELEDTNRGVVALYAELDERAERLRQADQLKSRFLSHMSHEFRTPLNAIVGLTRLLLRRSDVAASADTTREIQYIQRSAEELTELVNDLLDLAKVQAGRLTVHESQFTVSGLFGTLRTMMRPLSTNDAVELIFEESDAPPIISDENKLAQIIRNLVSNALKFTERGSVHVSAVHEPVQDMIRFAVVDTGIGIAPENFERIFDEFSQIDNPTQRRVKGTGLGLALCRRLAELLGGQVLVDSEPHVGSTFTVRLPRVYVSADRQPLPPGRSVLLIDDEEVSRYLIRQLLRGNAFEVMEAENGAGGLAQIQQRRPDLVFLDLTMPGLSGFGVLAQLKQDPTTRDIPVVVVTGQPLNDLQKQELASSTVAILSKEALGHAEALDIVFGPPISLMPRYPKDFQLGRLS